MNSANIVDGHAERFDPEVTSFDPATAREHIHRYFFARPFAAGKRVLDVACGVGYGSAILAEEGRIVTGLDRDAAAVEAARQRYGRRNLAFVRGCVETLPFADGAFDLVVCFETIEHIEEQAGCLAEIRRVLSAGGVLLASTPRKAAPGRDASANPFHVKELDRGEFEDLLRARFAHVRLFGQKVLAASAVWPLWAPPDMPHGAGTACSNPDGGPRAALTAAPDWEPDFFVAVASDEPVLPPKPSVHFDSGRDARGAHVEARGARRTSGGGSAGEGKPGMIADRPAARARIAAHAVDKLAEKESLIEALAGAAVEIRPLGERAQTSATFDGPISVVIPVRNGGRQLAALLGRIRSQRRVPDVEIIVADSGSTDGSAETAARFGARVIHVRPEDFNHGATRNAAAASASGELIVFTVQDALPINDYWLCRMASPFLEHRDLAAVTSRQFVREGADLYSRWRGEATKRFLCRSDVAFRIPDANVRSRWMHLDAMTKRRVSFVDNVASCVRREVFETMRFRPLPYAEDMDLGVRLIEKGYAVGYLPSTGVYHWHDRGADEVLKRHYLGTKASCRIMRDTPPFFYELLDVGWERLVCEAAALYRFVRALSEDSGPAGPSAGAASMACARALARLLRDNSDPRQPDAAAHADSRDRGIGPAPGALLSQVLGHGFTAAARRASRTGGIFVPTFALLFRGFAEYVGRCEDAGTRPAGEFTESLYKICASVVGEALARFFLESEQLGRLTPELLEMDARLAQGVCHS